MAAWTSADEALRSTVEVLAAVAAGRLQDRRPVRVIDPLIAPGDELVLVEGTYSLRGPLTPGDGLYEDAGDHRVLDSLTITHRAERRIAEGRVYVSTHGFYLRTRSGLTTWPWPLADSIHVVKRSVARFRGSTGRHYPATFTLRTHWAELVYGLWSLERLRIEGDKRLVTWLPAGWRHHAQLHGRWPDEQLTVLYEALGEPPFA